MDYQIKVFENNQWQEVDGWIRPIIDTDTLDETLAQGKFFIRGTTRTQFLPFTRCRIYIDSEYLERVIGTAHRTKMRFHGATLYDWEINTCELTKLLERDVIENMTFTHYMGHDFTAGAVWTGAPTESNEPHSTYYPNLGVPTSATVYSQMVKNPIPRGEQLAIYNMRLYTDGSLTTPVTTYIRITDPDDISLEYGTVNGDNGTLRGYYTPTKSGQYKISYWGYTTQLTPDMSAYIKYVLTYTTDCIVALRPQDDWNLSNATNRILNAGTTRRNGIDNPKYVFDSAQQAEFATVKIPDMYITRCTLYEALLNYIGAHIHAIPELYDNNGDLTVRFRKLGGLTVRTMPEPFIFEESVRDIDEFCGALDCPVENIINTIDKNQGAVTEPFGGGGITVRCETSGIEISSNTMVILTEGGVDQVGSENALFVCLPNSTTFYDITPYLYSDAEYASLSSYTGAVYPYSKAYALYYTQGDKHIRGLNFRLTGTTALSGAFQEYAIYNIVKQVTGYSLTAQDYIKLQFRFNYVSYIDTRVTQRKAYAGVWNRANTLVYNSSSNVVESSYLGEKMKGALLRLGEEAIMRTYVLDSYTDVPRVGELIDGMYVAITSCEYDRVSIKCTVTLTPNFNKLNEFVGINSEKRFFDVSERQSVTRYINYGESLLFTYDSLPLGNNVPMINGRGMNLLEGVLRQSSDYIEPSGAIVKTYDKYNTLIASVYRPLISFALGASFVFTFTFMDNYGAGYQAGNAYVSGSGASTIYKRAQKLVPYSDNYGNFYTMSVEGYERLWSSANDDGDNGKVASLYPQTDTSKTPSIPVMGRSDTTRFIVDKDSRECINFCYQLHAKIMDKNILVGSAFFQNSPLIAPTNIARAGKLYFLTRKINLLRDIIDLTGAVEGANTWTYSAKELRFDTVTSPINAQSWAIIDPTTNRLYIGANENLTIGGRPHKIYIGAISANKE